MVCKGDGSYGWKYSTKTKNRCRLSGVTESNSDNHDWGIGKQTKSSQGEGYDYQQSGISREVWNRLEAD